MNYENLIRWVAASVIKHFYAYKGDYPLSVDPERIEKRDKRAWVELRIDGPFFRKLAGYTQLDVEVNLLFSAHLDNDETRLLFQLQGQYLAAMLSSRNKTIPIEVRRYGDNPGDDGSLVGCLVITPIVSGDREIRASNFAKIDVGTRLWQGNLEAHYRMQVS
jgi:hypothetical protein